MEIVADFSTLASNPQAGTGEVRFAAYLFDNRYITATTSYGVATTFIMLGYDPASKSLRAWRNSGGDVSSIYGNLAELTASSRVDMAAYQGAHHVVLSINYGQAAELYIDGALMRTFDLSGTNAHVGRARDNEYGWAGALTVANASNKAGPSLMLGAHGTIAPLAVYPRALTAQDVSDLYNDVMVGTLPKLTGYAKEVVIDTPAIYVRLNEGANATTVRNLTRPIGYYDGYTSGTGTVTWQQPSVITGGNGALFDGTSNVRFDSDGGELPYSNGYTIEWLATPTTAAAPTGQTEWIYCATNTSESRVGPLVERTDGGNIQVTHSASGTETLTFATLMDDTAAMHHYAVRIDKTLTTATLFVDGAPVETLATSATILDSNYGRPDYVGHTHIGGKAADDATPYNGFHGVLTEVAAYDRALPDARIKAHYDARNTP